MSTVLWVIIGIIVVAAIAAAIVVALSRRATSKIVEGARAMRPPIGEMLDVGGRRFHVYQEGPKDAPAILFIHGLSGNLMNFTGTLFPLLRDKYRLIAVDRGGSGYSDQLWKDRGSPAEHAEDAAAVLDKLGIDKALWVGHSLGGAVSLTAALEQREKVAGLALISPLTEAQDSVQSNFKPLYIENPRMRRFVAETFAVPRSYKHGRELLGWVFHPQVPPKDYATAGGGAASLQPSHFYQSSTDIVSVNRSLPNHHTRWNEIDVPVGIIFGDSDRVLDYAKQGKAMESKLPGLDLETMEGVGHMPQFADPQRVASFIERQAAKAFGSPAAPSNAAPHA